MLRWRLWFPGLALATVGALSGVVTMVLYGNWGWSIWFALPFAAGSLLGYRFRSRWYVLPLLAVALTVTLCSGLMAMDLAGVFCGMALAGIFLGPVLIGALLGTVLRLVLKRTRFSQRWHLPALLLWSLPIVCAVIEGAPDQNLAIESVSTAMVVDAPIQATWDSLMFYEQVRHAPPLILKVGLARPLSASGGSWAPGERRSCVYNKGRLVKRITQSRPRELLAFDVIDQQIGYEHDVRLIGGSFDFESIDPERTRVMLTTNYRPLLSPRWCWRPFEKYAVRTLHGYVLEGIQIESQNRTTMDRAVAVAEPDDANLR